METIIFNIILFLIYFYILGSIFNNPKVEIEVKKEIKENPTLIKTKSRVEIIRTPHLNNLTYSQLVKLMSKKELNILPKNRKKEVLLKTLNIYAKTNPVHLNQKLKQLNYDSKIS